MDDASFLRGLADRGRVVILADGAAVPQPVSVMDNEGRAGATFRINLISPEEIESGDRRTFRKGTVTHRDLPLPLMWQWQLADGHKNAVVVGRIDYIEETPDGWGNARGVFDTGVWGRECERMVRDGMLRGVSGDYSQFQAQVLEKSDPEDQRVIDDKLSVDQSQLVAATVVAKPAFEGCYIEIIEDETSMPDGIHETPAQLTAAAIQALVNPQLVARVQQLEAELFKDLPLIASAASERVQQYRLEREREQAVARIRAAQNVTASWKGLSSKFLSEKAKLQPRDMRGRWVEMGAKIRWRQGDEAIGGVKRGRTVSKKDAPFKHGRVTAFDPKTRTYKVQPLDGSQSVQIAGSDFEIVKAIVPDTPDEAKKLTDPPTTGLDRTRGIDLSNGPPHKLPNAVPDPAPQGIDRTNGIDLSNGPPRLPSKPGADPAPQGLDRTRGIDLQNGVPGQVAPTRGDNLIQGRENLGHALFARLAKKNETWEKDGEKYMRAGDKLRNLTQTSWISDKRRQWVENTYGVDARPPSAPPMSWDSPPAPTPGAHEQSTWSPPDIKHFRVQKLKSLKEGDWVRGSVAGSDAEDSYRVVADWDKEHPNEIWVESPSTKGAIKLQPSSGALPAVSPQDVAFNEQKDKLAAQKKAVTAKPPKTGTDADVIKKMAGPTVQAEQDKNAKDDPFAAADKAQADGTQWGTPKPSSKSGTSTEKMPTADPKPGYKWEKVPQYGSNQPYKWQQVPDDTAPTQADLQTVNEPQGDPVATSVNDFRTLIDDLGVEGLGDHLDEVENNPESRTAMQFDDIEQKINDNAPYMTDSEETKVRAAFDKMKSAALDNSSSGDTIEGIDAKPAPPEPPTQADTLKQMENDLKDGAPDATSEPPTQVEIDNVAKTMFQNLHPGLDWDTADQDVWLKAAKKALDNNDS